jgi:aldehyde:ferredoxin oxidoreductase
MTKLLGSGRRYLFIDLSSESWEVRLFPLDQYRRYLGGEALAVSLWSSLVGDVGNVDPLGVDNPLCIVAGALTGTSTPCAGHISIVARSPLTSLLATASGAALFGSALKKAGWDALVLSGSSRRPMVLRVGPSSVEFRTSERLIGLSTEETVESLNLTEQERVLCIGPAGEKKVPFASIVSDGTCFDRGGLGAVLGSKQIKAMVVQEGDFEIEAVHPRIMSEAIDEVEKTVCASAYAKRLRIEGTLGLMDLAMADGFAPVDNFSKRTDPRLFHLSGDECRRRFSVDSVECGQCTMECRRTVQLSTGSMVLPDYAAVAMLGSNLGNYDLVLVLEWYRQCVLFGLDPVSTGNVLGWAMEAQLRGVIGWASSLAFGRTDTISLTIELIALRKGIGAQLSRGVRELSDAFGGTEFACHSAGLELSAFDGRGAWGEALLMALGEPFPSYAEILFPRFFAKGLGAKVAWAVFHEDLVSALRALGCCPHAAVPLIFERPHSAFFRSAVVSQLMVGFPSLMVKFFSPGLFGRLFLGLSGFEFSDRELLAVGKRAVALKRRLNTVMGMDSFPSVLPERFILDPASNHLREEVVPYRRMYLRYLRLRARDKEYCKEL